MNLYTEFLVAFMLVFAVGYTLAYLPGMLKMKAIYKRNLLFLVSVGLVLQLGNGLKLSYLWAVGFIFLIFNLYFESILCCHRFYSVFAYIVLVCLYCGGNG